MYAAPDEVARATSFNPLARPPGLSAGAPGAKYSRKQPVAAMPKLFMSLDECCCRRGNDSRTSEYDLSNLTWPAPDPPPPRSGLSSLLHWLVLRLKTLAIAAPLAAIALGVYAGLAPNFPKTVPIDYTLLAPIITCVFFVMSIVFSNVIADYKESEKIPADFVAYFSTLTVFAVSEARQRGFSSQPMLMDVQSMLICVLSTLDKKRGYASDLRAFHEAFVSYKAYARTQGVHEVEGPEHAATEISKKLTRIHDIGRLSIILPAYTLMDILVVALFGIVIVVDYKSENTNFAAISVLLTVAMYMNLLVRGLDDPFDGPDDYHFRCYSLCHEIPLSYFEAWKFGLMVNFACLTTDFGKMLRLLIVEAGSENNDGVIAPPVHEHH